jgi:hypothetical protein
MTPKKTTRKPTVLRVKYNNLGKSSNKSIASNTDSFEKMVFNEVIVAIESSNKKDVDLFELKESCAFITLNKNDFNKSLNKALIFFENKEDYELCSRCKTLLEKYPK